MKHLLAILLLLAFACEGQEWHAYKVVGKKRRATQVYVPPPTIAFTPNSLYFGVVPWGYSATLPFVITNGTASAIEATAHDTGEYYISGEPWYIPANSSYTVNIDYAPQYIDTGSTNMIFFYGVGVLTDQASVALLGYGSAPENWEGPDSTLGFYAGGTTAPDQMYSSTNLSMEGNYVMRRGVSAATGYSRVSLDTARKPAHAYFMYRWASGSGNISSFRDASTNSLCEVGIDSSRRLTIAMPGATTLTTGATPAGGSTTIHVWYGYGGSTGYVAWSASPVMPDLANTTYARTITNSTATANATMLQLGSATSSTITDFFDKVRYSSVTIGSNPL